MSEIDTLRFSTAGSVDDGKSTLIGRLLYEAHGIFADQLLSLESATTRHGHVDENDAIDFSLLTDGLIAEREQGITIDVAYRYFATPKRRFIIADTPGHEQYTRNMVTGASSADLTIVLLDAKRGVTMQTHRHAVIASLLGIPHLVVAINKMDLVSYNEATFTALKNSVAVFFGKLNFAQISFVPISALRGDMLTAHGSNMPWYQGPTILETLESSSAHQRRDETSSLYFPVQRVAKAKFGANRDLRGYQGQLVAGQLNVGDSLTILPARVKAKVTAILTMAPAANEVTAIDEARPGQAVTVVLDRQLDISRGDVFANSSYREPYVGCAFSASLCWFDSSIIDFQKRYWLKHVSKTVRAVVERVDFRLNVESLAHEETETVAMNDIVRVSITTSQPLVFDRYENCRKIGAFILIDDTTNRTVAGGMIVAPLNDP